MRFIYFTFACIYIFLASGSLQIVSSYVLKTNPSCACPMEDTSAKRCCCFKEVKKESSCCSSKKPKKPINYKSTPCESEDFIVLTRLKPATAPVDLRINITFQESAVVYHSDYFSFENPLNSGPSKIPIYFS